MSPGKRQNLARISIGCFSALVNCHPVAGLQSKLHEIHRSLLLAQASRSYTIVKTDMASHSETKSWNSPRGAEDAGQCLYSNEDWISLHRHLQHDTSPAMDILRRALHNVIEGTKACETRQTGTALETFCSVKDQLCVNKTFLEVKEDKGRKIHSQSSPGRLDVPLSPSRQPLQLPVPALPGGLNESMPLCPHHLVPCKYHWKPCGCRNAATCTRCHLCRPKTGMDRRQRKERARALQCTNMKKGD